MSKPPCLFHAQCGGISGTSEHVFPAAIGGLREDTRLLCEDCQSHFGNGLDGVLPRELRPFNTILGIKSRHRNVVRHAPVTDSVTGQQFLLDEELAIVSAQPVLRESSVDDAGLEQRHYTFIGDLGDIRDLDVTGFLERLREATGKAFKVVEPTTSRPVLMARPVSGDTSFGGNETFRAVARIALNFLGAEDPSLARAPGLEPLKRWIRDGEATATFADFADPIDTHLLPQNSFELGHRVALGFCSETQAISARVTLFGVHEIAVKLGAAPCPHSRVVVVDVDPKAQRAAPDLDRRRFVTGPSLVPSALGEFAQKRDAILRRNEKRTNELRAMANERKLDARFAPLVDKLNEARALLRFQQMQEIRRLVSAQQQMAFNLLVPAVRGTAQILERAGYVHHAEQLLTVIESEAGDVIVGKLGEGLAHQVLSAIASDLLNVMAEEPVTLDVAKSLFAGERGLRAAFGVVAEACAMMGLPTV